MKEIINEALKELNISAKKLVRPKDFPSVTWSSVIEKNKDYVEGNPLHRGYKIQFDVWDRKDCAELSDRVEKALSKAGFRLYHATDDFEERANIYHRILRFNYVKGVE